MNQCYTKENIQIIGEIMFKLLLSLSILLSFTACMPEPEENEFSQMRRDMQSHNSQRFTGSDESLKHRKDVKKQHKNYDFSDPDEELRIQKEEEKKRWLAVGIDEQEAEDWKALHLSPKMAKRWKKTGLSYNTIGVLVKEDVFPSEAVAFMNKKFDKNPKVFAAFGEPLYKFESSCREIVKDKKTELSIVTKQCNDYIQNMEFNSISGYLADVYGDNDLALEYISKLRQTDSQKVYIQSLMEEKNNDSMIKGDTKVFTLLFPILDHPPTEKEMHFIQKNKLALQDTHRYKTYKYYDFWVNKEKNEENARLAALDRQKALKRTKQKRLKSEARRLQALAYNKMVASECGDAVSADPSTGEKVHVEGRIVYTIGKRGSNIYAFIIKNKKDQKNYIIRGLNSNKHVDKSKSVSWIATTVGRVVSVSLDEEEGTASYDHYSDEDEREYFPMLKYSSGCSYKTKSVR